MNPSVLLLSIASVSLGAAPPPSNELPAAVKAILERADTVEVYSLELKRENEPVETFQGWKVIGKTTVAEEKVRRAVLGQIGDSFDKTPHWTKTRLMVVFPWYGVRIKQGDKAVDLLINYRWGWLTAQLGEKRVDKLSISNAAQRSLDTILKDANIPFSKGRLDEEKPSHLQTILQKAELSAVYSLEPLADAEEKVERFHGYTVLGQVAIKDAKTRKEIIDVLAPTVIPDVYWPSLMPLCFRPRHAFRMKYDGGTIDILICFECDRVELGFGGVSKEQIGKLAQREGWTIIYNSFALDGCRGQPLLDKLLREAKVPLAKPLRDP